MSKTYTAQEMREFANYNDAAYARNPGLYSSAVSAALRQAADALEREEKREKNYEYSLKTKSGHLIGIIVSSEEKARHHMISGDRIIRREVGEWEEF